MKLVLGIDLGTSYFKLGLFDKQGHLCGLGRVAVKTDTRDTSLCELPTDRFWKLLKNALADACSQAHANANDIQSLAYSSQANTFVLLDADNEPLTPLILWPDGRAKIVYPQLDQLWQREDFLWTTGIGIALCPQFCINKLLWFRENEPDLWTRVQRIMTISDYLTFSLTGKTVGDAGTASLLGLYDLPNQQWSSNALEAAQIQASQLSTPLLPGTIVGQLSRDGAKQLGLDVETVFAVGSLDHHLAAIGAGLGHLAEFSESTGTVLACLNFNKQYQPAPDRCLGPGINAEYYYQLAFNDNGAAALEWYQKKHAPDLSIEQLLSLAQSVPPDCDGLTAHPSANHYDGLAAFENRTDSHTHGHFIRAIMESTAKSLAQLVADLSGNEKPRRIVATGGGSKSDLWLQIKADMLGIEFATTNCDEPACKGAAILATVANKWFTSTASTAAAWVSPVRHFHPQ